MWTLAHICLTNVVVANKYLLHTFLNVTTIIPFINIKLCQLPNLISCHLPTLWTISCPFHNITAWLNLANCPPNKPAAAWSRNLPAVHVDIIKMSYPWCNDIKGKHCPNEGPRLIFFCFKHFARTSFFAEWPIVLQNPATVGLTMLFKLNAVLNPVCAWPSKNSFMCITDHWKNRFMSTHTTSGHDNMTKYHHNNDKYI